MSQNFEIVSLYGVSCYEQDEIQHREFRPVVHAHWIEHFEDFGESFFVECSACHF